MSLAAGSVPRIEGHRDSGPATRAAAHAQQCAGSRGRARQRQRTVEDLEQAPRFAHLLEVLEELRRLVVGTRARHTRLGPCGQNVEAFSRTQGLGRVSRAPDTKVSLFRQIINTDVTFMPRDTYSAPRPTPEVHRTGTVLTCPVRYARGATLTAARWPLARSHARLNGPYH